jgi:hypothetical protein
VLLRFFSHSPYILPSIIHCCNVGTNHWINYGRHDFRLVGNPICVVQFITRQSIMGWRCGRVCWRVARFITGPWQGSVQLSGQLKMTQLADRIPCEQNRTKWDTSVMTSRSRYSLYGFEAWLQSCTALLYFNRWNKHIESIKTISGKRSHHWFVPLCSASLDMYCI